MTNDEPLRDGDLRTAFTLLVRGFERLEDKVDQTIVTMQEVKEDQSAQMQISRQTLDEARATNGRVTIMEEWKRGHESVHTVRDTEDNLEAAFTRGEQSKEAEYRSRLQKIWKTVWGFAGKPLGATLLVTAGALGERVFRVIEGLF